MLKIATTSINTTTTTTTTKRDTFVSIGMRKD
jgi:hypothetical protein